MSDVKRNTGLKTIFSIFLGLMLAVFFGIGTRTFHPPPDQFENEIRELNIQEQNIRATKAPTEYTTEDRDQLTEISIKRSELIRKVGEPRKQWCLSTSIILIVFSTLTLVVSLVRATQLQVVSNGLLLGGVFTMLYGIGWIAFTGTSIFRFIVMTVALIITLVLGYVRFVSKGKTPPATEGGPVTEVHLPEEIERRLHDLEMRIESAAQALGKKNER